MTEHSLDSTTQLCAVWCAYTQGLLRWLDVRVWCAVHELVARRCQCRSGTTPCFTPAELVPLLGHPRGIASAVQRLTTIGFVTWRSNAIGFGLPHDSATVRAEMDAMLAQMPRRRCDLPVPRRILRFLAGGCRRSLFATVCGHLLTCVTYGQGHCRSGGYCTASWIADTFGVSLRSVKAARRHLLAIELLQAVPTSCLVRNRLGVKIIVNLHWVGPTRTRRPATNGHRGDSETVCTAAGVSSNAMSRGADNRHITHRTARMLPRTTVYPVVLLAPDVQQRAAAPSTTMFHDDTSPLFSAQHKLTPSAPPDVHEPAPPMTVHKLFCEEKDNQQPASGGPTERLSALVQHVQAEIKAGRLPRCEEPRIEYRAATVRAQLQPIAAPQRVTQPPTLQHVTLQDLRDMRRVLLLYAQAVEAKWIGNAEADRLTFVALAQHVVLYRPQNPGGLFHRLLTKRLFHYVTQEDEDQALARLKAYEREHGIRCFSGTKRTTRRAS